MINKHDKILKFTNVAKNVNIKANLKSNFAVVDQYSNFLKGFEAIADK